MKSNDSLLLIDYIYKNFNFVIVFYKLKPNKKKSF